MRQPDVFRKNSKIDKKVDISKKKDKNYQIKKDKKIIKKFNQNNKLQKKNKFFNLNILEKKKLKRKNQKQENKHYKISKIK